MTRIEVAPGVRQDFDRIVQHMLEFEAEQPADRVESIIAAIDLLAHSPMIGRPCRSELRELVIGRGHRGYIVLYRYFAEADTVLVLGLRSQREAGYRSDLSASDQR